VSTGFQGLFHPPLGVLFTFPSRYLYAIGRWKSLALEGGPPSFPQGFTCLVVLRMPTQRQAVLATGLSPALVPLPNAPAVLSLDLRCIENALLPFLLRPLPSSFPIDSGKGIQTSLWMGCPIRILKAHRLDAAPLERFVGLHVLHRPDAPRHPPRTLPRLCNTCVLHAQKDLCVWHTAVLTSRTIIRATSLHLLPAFHVSSIYQILSLGS